MTNGREKAGRMAAKNTSQSVARAVDILELLDRHGELGVTDISEALRLSKSVTFRLLTTLKTCRFLMQNPTNSKYYNGYRLLELGKNVKHQKELIAKALPYMRAVAAQTGESVNLVVPEDTHVVFLERIETADILQVAHAIGERRPMYCTSGGKAMLAHMPVAHIERLAACFTYERFTAATLTGADALMAELAAIRSCGYAIDRSEHSPHIRCVGAPLLNSRGEAVAGMSISVPTFKLDELATHFSDCIAVLTEACYTFSRRELHFADPLTGEA